MRWRGVRRPNVERKIWRFEVGDEPVPAGRPSTRGRANDAAEVGGRADDAAEVGEEPVGGGRPSTRGLADDAAEVGDEPDGEGRPNSLDYADDAAEVGDEPVGVGRPSTRDCAADAPEVGDEPVPREAAAEVGDEPEGEDRPYSRDYAGDAAEVGDDPVGEGRPPRTTAVAGGLGGATGKTTLLTEGARKQQQWPVTGAGGTGKTTLPTEGAGRAARRTARWPARDGDATATRRHTAGDPTKGTNSDGALPAPGPANDSSGRWPWLCHGKDGPAQRQRSGVAHEERLKGRRASGEAHGEQSWPAVGLIDSPVDF